MAALKPAQIDAFLANPGSTYSLALFYGPDRGLVSERSQALANVLAGSDADPFSYIRLDSADIASDPVRLADEALTVPLFGDRRVIAVRNVTPTGITKAVEPLLASPVEDSFIILEAGDLNRSAGLRKAFEKCRHAVAVPCYGDGDQDLERLIDTEVKLAGLRVDRDARIALKALLGGDRQASRNEIAKLCLYCAHGETITVQDVDAIVGDASAIQIDSVIDAAATGDLGKLDYGFQRLLASGTPAGVVVTLLIRHFQMLHRARGALETGTRADTIVAGLRPPIHFRRKDLISRQIKMWPLARLGGILSHLDETAEHSRRMPALAQSIVGEMLILIARGARQMR
jgi:DNA polymerase-3 subunit delta